MKGEKMSLLTTEVEISLNSKNVKHYESLGYSIPRHLDSNNNIRFTYNEKILLLYMIMKIQRKRPEKLIYKLRLKQVRGGLFL